MKLTESTIAILNNFSNINSGILFEQGKLLRTVSEQSNIYAEAEIDVEFPQNFAIYDLKQFLGNVNALKNCQLSFHDKYVTIFDDSISIRYYSCQPEFIVTPPKDKRISLDSPDVSFNLPNQVFSRIIRISSMNSLDTLAVTGKEGKLSISVIDNKNDTSNYASTDVGEYSGDDFSCHFKTENLKMLQDDYLVEIKFGKFAKITAVNKNVVYFIGMEQEKK